MKQQIINLFQRSCCRPGLVPFFTHLYKLSLRGMGILNSESLFVSGEEWLFKTISSHKKVATILDVGANDGGYANEMHRHFPNAQIYCFEPNPPTYQQLRHNLKKSSFHLFNLAVSDTVTNTHIYDFADDAPSKSTQPTSTLASLHPEVITKLHRQPSQAFPIKTTTIDVWAKKIKIKTIDWLKVDTEGHELAVLKGAAALINTQKISLIQLEFNEMNAYSHTHLRDIIEALPGYRLFRLLPRGWWPLDNYRPLTHEIFGFQNIVAINRQWQKTFQSKN
jgi:FkbM family methyltransferase